MDLMLIGKYMWTEPSVHSYSEFYTYCCMYLWKADTGCHQELKAQSHLNNQQPKAEKLWEDF